MNRRLKENCARLGGWPPVALLLLWVAVLTSSCAPVGPAGKNSDRLRQDWGIEITQLQLTANGYMVDFRYRVVDAEKARALFSHREQPYLLHQESGKVAGVPNMGKIGPLRNVGTPLQGKVYWMFFDNMKGLIQPGALVTVIIGDFRVADLVVM